MMPYKIYLDSSRIECKSNMILLSKLQFYFKRNGHDIINDPSIADYIIVNTCGFTKSAEDSSVDLFNAHKERCHEKVISIGCLNKINENLMSYFGPKVQPVVNLSSLDAIFYRKVKFSDVTDLYLDENLNKSFKNGELFRSSRALFKLLSPLFHKSKLFNNLNDHIRRTRKVFVQIGSGCVSKCSYCIIKKAKGDPISRSAEDIMKDISKVAKDKNRLFLVADDCGSYGVDIGSDFPALLKQIGHEFPHLEIEICFLNPYWLNGHYEKKYINIFKNYKIHNVNISVQSGSNKVIQRMNRKYDVNKTVGVIKKIKNESPSTYIYNNLIVGFPGETLSDFMKTLFVMRHFDASMIFSYSDREGTESYTYQNKNSKYMITLKYFIASIVTRLVTVSKISKEIFSKTDEQ